ncbi:MAG TPA: uroporphyrinogen decarboxylase family protein [Spirochaetia bacterium]|nr:uroporphyrinogen decarboxylase family protein [Spirochaetia bacterium]
MTPRERVRTALEHREPDRVPVDNNGGVSSIHEVAYANLIARLGYCEEITVFDAVQRLALASEPVLCALGVDTRYLYPNAPSGWTYQEKPDGTWTDEYGTTYRRVGFYADAVAPVLRAASLAEVKAYKFPDPTDASRFKGLREKALALHRQTDYALVSGAILCFDYIRWVLRGLEQATADLLEEPRLAAYLLDAIVDWMIAYGQRIMDEVGDLIEFFWTGDDWGGQGGPFYSPEMFRTVFKPRIARLIGGIKKKTRAKCAYHCCGSVRWAIPDLMEAGVDILHPLQPSAHGNEDTAGIKKEFGGNLCFHGGTNNQGLFHGDALPLEIDTLKRIRDFAPGGGYIFSSGHNIQANMPASNVELLFSLGRRWGHYPIDTRAINERIRELEATAPVGTPVGTPAGAPAGAPAP